MCRRSSANIFFSIERARESDASQISSLYKKVWDEYKGKFPNELIVAREPSVKQVRRWIKQDTYFVTKEDGKVVGVVGCSLKHGTCLLVHMVVDKNKRNKGIGSALTEKVITYARENNAIKVWLDTSPVLKEAISIYRRFGFVKCGHLRKHYWGEDIDLYELVF